MELTNSQTEVVSELTSYAISSLESNTVDYQIFKAPTGSGKTFMILNFIDHLVEWSKDNPDEKLVFYINTLSTACLPQQLEKSFNNYKQYIKNKDLVIKRLKSPSAKAKTKKTEQTFEFFAEENNVFIAGSSSFTAKSLYTIYGAVDKFLDQIRNNKYKLIYIRDEAHHGGDADIKIRESEEEKNYEAKMQSAAAFVVKMSASPKSGENLVELEHQSLQNDNIQLLKTKKNYNVNISSLDVLDDEIILRKACEKFKEIKQKYNDNINQPHLIGINAAMLIQVNNDSKDKEKSAKFNQNIDMIIKVLEENNLKWVKYFDNTKSDCFTVIDSNIRLAGGDTLFDISRNNSPVDVIIFKIGPATGWNIPRACMLVQLRNVYSGTLNTQTLGRIKRNPVPVDNLPANSAALEYYIYSNVDIKDQQYQKLVLKDKYKNKTFISGHIENFVKWNEVDENEYQKQAIDEINKFLVDDFTKEYQNILNEFKQNKFIVAEKRDYGDGHFVTYKVKNLIEIEIFNLKELKKHKDYLNENIKKHINNFFTENKLNQQINHTMLWYLFIQIKLPVFVNLKKSLKKQKNEQNNLVFTVDDKLTLKERIQILQEERTQEIFNNNYAYKKEKLDPNQKDSNKLELVYDSVPEKIFIEKLNAWDNKHSKAKSDDKNNVEIMFTKNIPFKGIGFEYIADQELRTSFVDFIIKYNNHEIHIEVKALNQNNSTTNAPAKTEYIKNAYKEYVEAYQKQKTKENNKHFSLIIAYVSTDPKNPIYFKGHSDIYSLNKKLNESKDPKGIPIVLDTLLEWPADSNEQDVVNNTQHNNQAA
ncbi:DEAD/DEAH box helicase family protein [Mycoplasma sp. 246B]